MFLGSVLVVIRLSRKVVVRVVGWSGGRDGLGIGAVTLRRPSVCDPASSPSVIVVTLVVPVTGVGGGREVIILKLVVRREGLGT